MFPSFSLIADKICSFSMIFRLMNKKKSPEPGHCCPSSELLALCGFGRSLFIFVATVGIEPTAFRVSGGRSDQLSYIAIHCRRRRLCGYIFCNACISFGTGSYRTRCALREVSGRTRGIELTSRGRRCRSDPDLLLLLLS